MVRSKNLLVIGALFSFAFAHVPEMGKRAPFQAVGIEKNKEGFGSEAVAEDENLAVFAPPSQLGKKNATMPQLKDRSLELVDRQSCDAGYWYCSAFGRCCPRSSMCCSYGYCIDPDDTCCPDGPCDPGWNCCGNNCSPKDGDCCSDGNYCEAGNVCVKLFSNGRIVCCTDLKCTAAVVSGTTSYVTTTSQLDLPSITSPPLTTEIVSVGGSYTTWYWTVTWWYFSFYWSTFRAESTVTYTRVYETTTFTTTATDEFEASSLFSSLSETLTFEPPEDAQTSLASLLNVEPSATGESTFSFGDLETTEGPEETRSSTSTASASASASASRATTGTASTSTPPGGANSASGVFVQWLLIGVGACSGVLMVWL